jgi:chromosome segregation ATPase
MKCDELEFFFGGAASWAEVYKKSDVDAAIDELKAENERLSNALDKERSETIKYMDELCNAKNEIERLTIDKRNVELRADAADSTIEKLKKKMDDYHLMSDIRRAKIKEQKHALWLARVELCHRLDVDRYLRKHRNSWYNENCLTWAEACVAMEVKMCKAESKCRAKAEEYK